TATESGASSHGSGKPCWPRNSTNSPIRARLLTLSHVSCIRKAPVSARRPKRVRSLQREREGRARFIGRRLRTSRPCRAVARKYAPSAPAAKWVLKRVQDDGLEGWEMDPNPLHLRHPELVSGPIGQHARTHAVRAQPLRLHPRE